MALSGTTSVDHCLRWFDVDFVTVTSAESTLLVLGNIYYVFIRQIRCYSVECLFVDFDLICM